MLSISGSMRKSIYNPLEVPNYDVVSASRYLHIPESTLHFWTSGREPIVRVQRCGRSPLLSFKNLVECYVVQGIRTIHEVRVPKIRAAAQWMHRNLSSPNPLADFDLRTDGKDLFLEIEGRLVNLSMPRHQGQQANELLLTKHLQRIERNEHGVAMRLLPYKSRADMHATDASRLILIDPYISFGRPILKESGIPTAVLAGRFKAGDSISVLARSYGRKESEIKEAVEWEIGRAA